MRRLLNLLLFFPFVLLTSAPAQDHRRVLPPRPECFPCLRGLQTQELSVKVKLDEKTAVTDVEQILYNPGRRRLEEATWIFPLPRGAAVESFRLVIDGREVEAELLDADKARQIYTDIVRRARDPALLSYMGGGLLKAQIFPVPAGGTRSVMLRYREVIDSEDGLRRYRYPLGSARLAGNRIGRFIFEASLATDAPLQTVYAPSHEMRLERPSARKAKLSAELRDLLPSRDVDLLFSTGQGFGMDLLTHANGDERYFWLTLAPNLEADAVVDKDIVLVLDNSGSMTGGKLEAAVKALSFCLDNLGKGDRFEIVRFSTEAEAMAGELLPATRANRERARDFIEDLRPIGGTNLEEALRLALDRKATKDRPLAVVLITDGKPTVGETRENALVTPIRDNGFAGRIFTFGIGYDLNVHLLDQLAEAGRGRHTYARPDEELELKLSSFVARLQAPVMTDPKLEVKGVRVTELQPVRLPDLFRGTPLHVFGRYRGSGMATVKLTGRIAGRRETLAQELRFAKRASDNSFIPDLWARRRVGYLLDQIRLNGERKELVDEVTRLARRHGIVTPYTSYLVVEDEPVAATRREGHEPPSFVIQEQLVIRAPRAKEGADAVSYSESLRVMNEAESVAPEPKKLAEVRRIAAGRAFYRKDEVWVDSDLEADARAEVELVFDSKAYWDFLADHPEAVEILALGERVLFAFAGKVYAVVP